MFEHVLSKGKIGNLEIKNRFVMPAMGSGHATHKGELGDASFGWYVARAKGGFGLIITEYVAVDPDGIGALNELRLYSDEYIPMFKRMIDACHEEGAKVFIQLHHGGRWADSKLSQGTPNAPNVSSSPLVWHIRDELVHELTTEEVYAMIERFGDAAVRAKKAGADGVELHGGHAYLIPQFMSAAFNKRTDEFGGDLLGRSKFATSIIRNVKEKCGADFPVQMRISADESLHGGMKTIEMRAMMKLLVEAGLDSVNCSVDTPSAYGDQGRSIGGFRNNMGFVAHIAAEIKQAVDIPVIAVGRMLDPVFTDMIIADGYADFVALGRASIADSEFAKKVTEGRTDEICNCTGCLATCSSAPDENGVSVGSTCAFNPFSGREYKMKIEPAEVKKNIVVVGGGLAGMEAAWIAAVRGHSVTLFEKSGKLGGQAIAASMPPYMQSFAVAIKYHITMCKKHKVDIRMNTEATAEAVLALKPDEVIIATGAEPVVLDIPGEGIPVVQALDVLNGKVVPGYNLIIAGGGLVGINTAEFVLENMRKVTVLEIPGGDADPMTKMMHMKQLNEGGVKIMAKTNIERITAEGAVCSGPEGELTIPADMIIMAAGSKSCNALAGELAGKVPVHVIGDAVQPRRIKDALLEAAEIAIAI